MAVYFTFVLLSLVLLNNFGDTWRYKKCQTVRKHHLQTPIGGVKLSKQEISRASSVKALDVSQNKDPNSTGVTKSNLLLPMYFVVSFLVVVICFPNKWRY